MCQKYLALSPCSTLEFQLGTVQMRIPTYESCSGPVPVMLASSLLGASFFRESRNAARPAARHAVGMSDMSRAGSTGASFSRITSPGSLTHPLFEEITTHESADGRNVCRMAQLVAQNQKFLEPEKRGNNCSWRLWNSRSQPGS